MLSRLLSHDSRRCPFRYQHDGTDDGTRARCPMPDGARNLPSSVSSFFNMTPVNEKLRMSRRIVLCYGKTECHFHGLCIADVVLKNLSYKTVCVSVLGAGV